MIFNFRKIASVLSSAAMISSTVALAAAANFPAPFVSGGAGDVAVVYGANAATTDLLASVDIQSALSTELAKQTASGGAIGSSSVTGEAAPLFTSGTKLYINDSLNIVKSALTDSVLPTVLKDSSFSGNVDASVIQTINIGSFPRVTFKKQPTTSNEPAYGLTTSTDVDNEYLYNATVTFSKEVNLTHADSKGAELNIFGTTYTISAATTATDLVLLKSAEKMALSSDDPTAEVTIGGKVYTVTLVSASDTAATVKVTDETGKSESKEISENNSKKVNGITIAITNADETNLKLSANVIAGSDKVTLTDNSEVKIGEEDTTISGTEVRFVGTGDSNISASSKIIFSVSAEGGDSDAIIQGSSLVDPIFGMFKVDFSGLNIADDSTTAREEIKVVSSGDDKMQVTFTDYEKNGKSIVFAKNVTSGNPKFQIASHSGTYNSSLVLQYDDDGHNISVREGQILTRNDYAVLGNEDDGRLVRLSSVKNATAVYPTSGDKVEFTDVMSGDIYTTTFNGEGTGTVLIKGNQYNIRYWGASSSSEQDFNVTVDYPDSTGTQVVLYPTIQTSKGAKLAFYTPVTVNLTNFRDSGRVVAAGLETYGTVNVSAFKIPNGNGYTTVTVTTWNDQGNYSINGGTLNISDSPTDVVPGDVAAVGNLRVNFTAGFDNRSTVYLVSSADSSANANLNIKGPAIILWEEKDDNNEYQASVVMLEEGGNGDDGVGVEDVTNTWINDSTDWLATIPSDSKITKIGDLFGTIVTLDKGDSDQTQATLSYPDEQVYANLYVGEKASEITISGAAGGSVTSLGDILVTDGEASSVSAKNLVVVGGSCINSVAADLLGGSLCSANFESKTGVGAGSFLIETFSRTNGKVATLVAGYNAGDTTNAAKFLTTQTVDTTAGKKYKGTSATSAELVTTVTA